jgi:uncharacterized membrane protein (UPF0127 family)
MQTYECWTENTRFSAVQRSAFIISLFLLACAPSPPEVVVYPHTGDPVRVSVEIADTPQTRRYGLMYRTTLPDRHGMLFVFPSQTAQSFWMKNTPLSLDIIFINAAHSIVHIAAHTTPFSERPIPSPQAAQFVLEVKAGFCKRHGIRRGARVEFVRVPTPPSR